MLVQENIVSFMAIWRERRKGRITYVGCVYGGRGLVRDRHLTPKESIIAAFKKLKLNMQTLWMKHLIVLDISWIYSQQPLILKEEHSPVPKAVNSLFHRKAHFMVVPTDNFSFKTSNLWDNRRRVCLSGHTVFPERVFRSYNWLLLNTGAILQ